MYIKQVYHGMMEGTCHVSALTLAGFIGFIPLREIRTF